MQNLKTTQPITHLLNLLNTSLENPDNSHPPNDGSFIGDDDLTDGFSSRGTVRYGEEVDADDL